MTHDLEPPGDLPASLMDTFREEAKEILLDMEGALMELEQRPADGELIARAFRALHTIKGNSAMFGLEEMEAFAHDLEHVFDQLRRGGMPVTKEIIDLTLEGRDQLLILLLQEGGSAPDRGRRAALRSQIAGLGAPRPPAACPAPPPLEEEPPALPPMLVEAFKDEARDLLADLESALMELERRPDDADLIARAFRSLHTIKGNGGMFGFAELEIFAHELENVFDLLRRGKVPVTHELIELTLAAKDRILRMLAGQGDTNEERELREHEVEALHRIADAPAGASSSPGDAVVPAAAGKHLHKIRFRPDRGLLGGGTDPLSVFEELNGLGTCRVAVCLDELPPLGELDPEAIYLAWDIELEGSCGVQEIRDAFIFVGGDAVISLAEVPGPAPAGAGPLETRGGAAPAPAAACGECGPSDAARAAAVRKAAASLGAAESASTLRVSSGKLDKLVNLVGELVTIQARLSRVAESRHDPELVGVAEEVERLTADLRDSTMSVRMVPIGPTFGKFRRLVRDLARGIGRDVDLVTEGDETELDKTVIDRLSDPLVHLLRNSIDHGIEDPGARERAGKPASGTVRISAGYSGANVVIRVEDDGGGIDLEAVRRKAIQRGIIAENDARADRELYALMFLPGFSTSAQVTNISGRGVGLDVVKRAVEALRGSIAVESRRGAGTTFEVRLPLTLAIIEGLEVVVSEEHFIVPLGAVRECVELVRRERGAGPGEGRRLADIRGELVPYVHLRDWFGIGGDPPPIEQIVVTETDGFRVGLAVDYVVGEQQTVIKSLGRIFREVRGLAGATILGDGSVALILDVLQLVQLAEREETERSRRC